MKLWFSKKYCYQFYTAACSAQKAFLPTSDLQSEVLTLLAVAYCVTPFRHQHANKCACAYNIAIENHIIYTCYKQLLTSYITENQ